MATELVFRYRRSGHCLGITCLGIRVPDRISAILSQLSYVVADDGSHAWAPGIHLKTGKLLCSWIRPSPMLLLHVFREYDKGWKIFSLGSALPSKWRKLLNYFREVRVNRYTFEKSQDFVSLICIKFGIRGFRITLIILDVLLSLGCTIWSFSVQS